MPAGVCGVCHRVYNEKHSIKCIGPCASHYHLSCVKIDPSENEFFIIDGVSIYKCYNCTRRGNDDMCVTPVTSHHKVRATESSLLPSQDKHVKNNFECLVIEKLNILKENDDSVLLHIKDILNEMRQISADLSVLRSENVALKCLLTECFKQNEVHSSMKPDNVISLMKGIQSSKSRINNCPGEPSQSTLASEDLCFTFVHKKVRMQRSEFSQPKSKSTEKILKIESFFNSGVSSSVLNPKMKALPEVKADEVKELLESYN